MRATEKPDAMAIELALLAVHANFLAEIAPDPLEAARGAGEELQRMVAARDRTRGPCRNASTRLGGEVMSRASIFGDISNRVLLLTVELWLAVLSLPWIAMFAVDEQLALRLAKQLAQ